MIPEFCTGFLGRHWIDTITSPGKVTRFQSVPSDHRYLPSQYLSVSSLPQLQHQVFKPWGKLCSAALRNVPVLVIKGAV